MLLQRIKRAFRNVTPKPDQISKLKFPLVVVRTIFCLTSFSLLCYWALYEGVIIFFQDGSFPVLQGNVEKNPQIPICAYVCGKKDYLNSMQVEILDLETKQVEYKDLQTNSMVHQMSISERNQFSIPASQNSEKCFIFQPDEPLLNIFAPNKNRHNVILIIFWNSPGDTQVINVTLDVQYLFGLYACDGGSETKRNVIPYSLSFPSINTFTFSVNEYYDSENNFPLGLSRTDVVFRRQSLDTLTAFGYQSIAARIVYSPEGYSTIVQQFTTSHAYNLFVSLGSAGGYIKWVLLFYFLLFGDFRLGVPGLVFYIYEKWSRKIDQDKNDGQKDAIKFLMNQRFKEFEKRLSKNYLNGIKLDFEPEEDTASSKATLVADDGDPSEVSQQQRGLMNRISWEVPEEQDTIAVVR